MRPDINRLRENRRTVMDAAMIFVIILLITQMWLLTATLESYLAGYVDVALPGMLASGILFIVCLGLYRFVDKADRLHGR